jgi:lipoprotein
MFKIKISTLTFLLTFSTISGCTSTPIENETKKTMKDVEKVTITFKNGSEISTIDKKIISVDGSKVIFDLSQFGDAFIEGDN